MASLFYFIYCDKLMFSVKFSYGFGFFLQTVRAVELSLSVKLICNDGKAVDTGFGFLYVTEKGNLSVSKKC